MRLTSLSHGAGCACKVDAAQLAEIRASLPSLDDPDLLVGAETADDAAVYRLDTDLAIVQTLDFFTPIVDDPFDFGRIAAANALSDIYAMGAAPLMALNILAFSLESLGRETLSAILEGGGAIASQAKVPIAGGHSIDDREPKYGMAVTGIVSPTQMLRNAGGEPNDVLLLTKPIGGGLVTTAAKRELTEPNVLAAAIEVMTTLNDTASTQTLESGAHAATDVTGFGLIGHLHEMCVGSGLAAEIGARAVPRIKGASELAANPLCQSGGSRRNAEHARRFTSWEDDVSDSERVLLTDAMTSGGLLIAVPEERVSDAPGVPIGRLRQGNPGRIGVTETLPDLPPSSGK